MLLALVTCHVRHGLFRHGRNVKGKHAVIVVGPPQTHIVPRTR